MRELLAKAGQARRAGRYDEAEAAYRAWIAAEPANPEPRYGLSLLLLQRGAWREGWAHYEARADVAGVGVRKPRMSFAEWTGQPVRSLVVFPEQGIGDQIMFARYIPLLVSQGMEVTLITPPPLARLFEPLGARIITGAGGVEIPRADAWCLIGSLPHLTGELPGAPYLAGGVGGQGLGVKWSGNPAQVNNVNRSIPEPLAGRLRALGRPLDPEFTGARDFEDTRRLIANLGAVASVCTSVAHLAGAMGAPTFVLLGADPDWRWGNDDTTPWYPGARILRQRSPGDWSSVLDQLAAAIA